MEPKKDLNNTQRKMLDEVYMEHFDAVAKRILNKRKDEYQKLEEELLKGAQKKYSKEISDFNKMCIKMTELSRKIYEESGFEIQADGYRSEIKYNFVIKFRSESRHPKLQAHEEETDKIRLSLAQKKKEIRSRIYGLDMTYETIDSEIKKEIASLKY